MSQSNTPRTTRRGFIAALAGAAPLALVPAVAVKAASAPLPAHDPEDEDGCPCAECRRARVERGNDPLILAAAVAGWRAVAALNHLAAQDRLAEEARYAPGAQDYLDIPGIAGHIAIAIEPTVQLLHGELIGAAHEKATAARDSGHFRPGLTPYETGVVALWDYIDALSALEADGPGGIDYLDSDVWLVEVLVGCVDQMGTDRIHRREWEVRAAMKARASRQA